MGVDGCPAPERLEVADVNRRYFVDYVTAQRGARALRVLDFGCGTGDLVSLLRAEGIDAWGADTFYDGANCEGVDLDAIVRGGVIRRIPEDGRIPFDDDYFDLIVSDQVLEHVEQLTEVLIELSRVLAPGGRMYHHFPVANCWREGHCGIPFAHWFRPGPLRTRYLVTMRTLGLGRYKDLSGRAWADRAMAFMDDYCRYRSYTEIRSMFGQRFIMQSQEINYCRFRAGDRQPLAWLLSRVSFRGASEWLFRRLGFAAVELRPIVQSSAP